MLSDLRAERAQIDEVIKSLERLDAAADGNGAVKKRRGRPPNWLRAMRAEENTAPEPRVENAAAD